MDNIARITLGKDLGIVIGNGLCPAINGVFVYQPLDYFIPHNYLPENELVDLLNNGYNNISKCIRFSYPVVKQVFVNNKIVWQNRNSFDRIFHGITNARQAYVGRGDVDLEVDTFNLSCKDPKDLLKLWTFSPIGLKYELYHMIHHQIIS